MIGTKQIILDASEWLKGMSSGADISDGGFSTDTEAVNLKAEPGIVYAPAASVDSDTDNRLTGDLIASSPDMTNFGGDERLLIARDDGQDGTFYRYNGTKISAAALATDTTNNYEQGFTDIITFKGEAYVTTKELIKRWQADNTISDLSGGGFTSTTFPHPAIVFKDFAYYGDGNLLRRQTVANGTPTVILTLSSEHIIIALGIDPGTGRLLISTTSSLNISNTIAGVHKVHWYDGASPQPIKVVVVEDMIMAFHSHGGFVFVGYGQNLGFLNGAGIKFLRVLQNVTQDNRLLPYKQKFTSIGDTMYVVDGTKVLAYGPVLGQNIFYYALKNKVNSNNIDHIFNAGGNKMGFGTTMGSNIGDFHTVSMTSIANLDKFDFRTNPINFPRSVHISNLQLEFFEDIASTSNLSVTARNEEKDASAISESLDGTITSRRVLRKMGGFPKRVDSISFQIENATTNAGLKRVIIYYDFLE